MIKKWKVGIDLLNCEQDINLLAKKLAQQVVEGACYYFFLTPDILESATLDILKKKENIELVFCKESITREDNPLFAIRRKQESTLIQAIKWLADDKLDSLVSLGHTGALVGATMILLPTIIPDLITRPALVVNIPTIDNSMSVLDVGANITSKPHFLIQWAKLGIAYRKTLGCKNPRLGLLNIGSSAGHGNNFVKNVYQQLDTCKSFNFKGNIEGHNAFDGLVDVLLMDGFIGNVFLKALEGASQFFLNMLSPVKPSIAQFFDKNRGQGALLLGIKKPVIKCHRYSNYRAIQSAIKHNVKALNDDIYSQIANNAVELFAL